MFDGDGSGPDLRFRAYLRYCWRAPSARYTVPLVAVSGLSVARKSGWAFGLILLVSAVVVLLPVGFAYWRSRERRGLDS